MKHLFLLGLALLAACATPKSELIDSGSFEIAEAKQEKSIALKRACAPIAMRQAMTDKDAVVFAIQNRADTVQIFRSYQQPIDGYRSQLVRDLRFWQCEGKKAVAIVKKAIKTRHEKARVAFIRFENTTVKDKENYNWLEESLPEAMDAAMQTQFIYQSADRQKTQEMFDAIAKGNQAVDARFLALCEKAELDYAIGGTYAFDERTKKIKINAVLYHGEKRTPIGTLSASSAVDASIFGELAKVADQVVKTLAVYEVKR